MYSGHNMYPIMEDKFSYFSTAWNRCLGVGGWWVVGGGWVGGGWWMGGANI
jgi:hypothetical protein